MHTYVKKPPVNQRQVHEPQRPTNSQPRHVDKRPAAQRMAALQRLAATCVRPQDQKIAQLKALANTHTPAQRFPIQRQPTDLKAQMGAQHGVDLSEVKEISNSSFPTSVGALATIQGNRIDYAPGQFTTANRKHELGHAIDNAIHGTPRGDTLVNGQNVDTTRETAAQKIADTPLQQQTIPITFANTANQGPLQRRPIDGKTINDAPVYIQTHNKTAEAEAEAAEPASAIGTPVPEDKKLRQIGHINEKEDVTVEDSVMRGDRVALDLSTKDVPSALNLVGKGVDKKSFEKPPSKGNTLTPYIRMDDFDTDKGEFYYSKATHSKKKADSAEKKSGKEEKMNEFKKDLFNSFLELKDKDGLKDFDLNKFHSKSPRMKNPY